MKQDGRVARITGPTVEADGIDGPFMREVVQVGPDRLMGEVIRIEGDRATLQVYEDTRGLKAGDPLYRSGELFTVELGPGLLGTIYDGVQRPLALLAESWGDFIDRGARVYRLDRERQWTFAPTVAPGDEVTGGRVVGTVQESGPILHRIMVPHGMSGTVAEVMPGQWRVNDTVVRLEGGKEITLSQRWDIRKPRPKGRRLKLTAPLITGQRVVDTLFPVAEGGAAIIPGGFGTGKTMLEQSVARRGKADVVVYVGCGERGNEMAETLDQLQRLTDPATGEPLMNRTVLIANTSNMPVAAREASIYTGVTIAEYYRDMGYSVILLADSTSRWAEALREISSRLEEIPGEEGYPSYLPSLLSAFYERAGTTTIKGRENESGAVTIIGAVSPPGGDFSEPVTQASLRMASTFWGLDPELANQRHFPAINWRSSYSLVAGQLAPWYREKVDEEWEGMVTRLGALLQREEELEEIARVVGADALEERDRFTLATARWAREGYLRQSAVHPVDGFCPPEKQAVMLTALMAFIDRAKLALDGGESLETVTDPALVTRLLRMKEREGDDLSKEIADLMATAERRFVREER